MSETLDRTISEQAGEEYSLAAFGIALSAQDRGWFAQEILRSALALEAAALAAGPLFDVRMHGFDALLGAANAG